jgi:carboxylesterase type B
MREISLLAWQESDDQVVRFRSRKPIGSEPLTRQFDNGPWMNFAKTGNPNGSVNLPWPPFTRGLEGHLNEDIPFVDGNHSAIQSQL